MYFCRMFQKTGLYSKKLSPINFKKGEYFQHAMEYFIVTDIISGKMTK